VIRRVPSPSLVARVAWIGLAVVSAMLLVTSCRNLLGPNKAEPPSTDEGSYTVTVDFASPEGVLATVADAIRARGRPGNGAAAYISSFANPDDGIPFTVTFDPDVVVNRQNAGKRWPDPWLRTHESQFYTHLVSLKANDEYSMLWTNYAGAPADEVDESDNVVTLHRQYRVQGLEADDVTEDPIAFGRATLVLQQASPNRWLITSWQDTIDPTAGPDPSEAGDRSFSRLRIDTFAP
jgi:hypothetical protein